MSEADRQPAVAEHPSAQSWAAELRPGRPVRWRGLEVAAFAPHPDVLDRLDPGGLLSRLSHRPVRTTLTLAWAVPLGIVVAAVYGGPVWAYAALLGDRFGRSHPDPHLSIPVAGAFFSVSLVPLLVHFVLFLRRGRRRNRMEEVLALPYAGLGTLSSGIAALRGRREDVAHWLLWVTPMAAVAAVGTVYLVLLLTSRRRADRFGTDDYRAREGLRFARLQRQIDRLPESARTAVRADLARAIDDLVERGVVSVTDGQRAHRAGLGRLALEMSQRRSRTSPPDGAT